MIAKGGDTRRPVCVVDDDASVREAVGGLLRSVGMTVETFGSAREFLASVRRDAPSCLVLDVELRSEEHTSELQSRPHLVCRLLLEKKNTCLLTYDRIE